MIVRSTPDAPADAQSMLVVTGACWSLTHKHVDDLSLFEFERKIFIDSGMLSYTWGAMRLYVLSADSHNTVSLLDNQLLPKAIEIKAPARSPSRFAGPTFE